MKKEHAILALALVLSACGCAASGTGSATQSKSAPPSTAAAAKASTPASGAAATAGVITLPSGLRYEDLKVGDGAVATSGTKVSVHYTGWLTDGTKFDSSLDRGEPFVFSLGAGNVIRGWDEGVKGMKVGGKRKLTIPPDLGYGAAGAAGVIPPNSTLVFEIELLNVQ